MRYWAQFITDTDPTNRKTKTYKPTNINTIHEYRESCVLKCGAIGKGEVIKIR